jgi:hypothetical protein
MLLDAPLERLSAAAGVPVAEIKVGVQRVQLCLAARCETRATYGLRIYIWESIARGSCCQRCGARRAHASGCGAVG